MKFVSPPLPGLKKTPCQFFLLYLKTNVCGDFKVKKSHCTCFLNLKKIPTCLAYYKNQDR